tara:strand:+ start:15387 stop:16853 length:1467 start_codon:yes stop_codon:yes gene_type:complete
MGKLIGEVMEDLQAAQVECSENNDFEKLQTVMDGYQQLLLEAPHDPYIIFQLGTAHLQKQEYGVALVILQRVLDYLPDNSHVWSNIGCCYRAMHMLPQARDCFMKSLMLEEKAETYSNLASSYVNEDAPEEGWPYAIKAMELEPDTAKARWNASLLQLEMRNWKEGFALYDAGFFCGERGLRSYSNDTPDSTDWFDGNLQSGKTLALWDEQGLGDRLLAAGLLPKLEKANLDIILECHPRLEAIYKRSFPWINKIYPTAKKSFIEWPNDHPVDQKSAVFSLAKHFWKTEADMSTWSYLKPNPKLLEMYRKQFEALGPPPYYGLSWKGGALKTNTQYRSMKLGWFENVIKRAGGTWISMQYHEDAKEKVERMREQTGLPIFHCDAAQEMDYDHTLSALAALDHTITCCNTVVHTCGAAGLKCTVLVPKKRAWRYPAGPYFPWYSDDIVMFHQTTDQEWKEVLEVLGGSLENAYNHNRSRSVDSKTETRQ